MTINFWAYAEDWTTQTSARFFSCTESGGFNTQGGKSGYLRFPVYVCTNEAQTTYAYKYDSQELKLADLTPGWHMFTYIYQASSGTKVYIDAKLHHTYNNVSYGIRFNMNARLFLGCQAAAANPSSPYFNGKESDFRLYYTVLSNQDISQLYHTSALADRNSNFYTYSYQEQNNITTHFSKKGICYNNNLIEDNLKTISGSITHFEDGAEADAKSVIAHIEPVQEGSGDPSPDNIRPITGHTEMGVLRTGKNLLWKARQSSTMNGITWTLNDDGSITASGTSTGRSYIRIIISARDFYTLPKGTYTYSLTPTGSDYENIISLIGSYKGNTYYKNVCHVSSLNNFAGVFTWNDSDMTAVFDIAVEITQADKTVNCTVYPQIELGSTATDYEPYQGETYPITFPSSAGTVYGGYVDATMGKLVVTHLFWTDNGSASWVRNADGSFYTRQSWVSSAVQDATGCACNYAPFALSFDGLAVFVRPAQGLISLGKGWGDIYSTVDALKTAFASMPFQIVYKLSTPIEYDLTPQQITTLLGTNNIWNDTNGDTEVEYRTSQKKIYINRENEVFSNNFIQI